MERLFHIAFAYDWEVACRGGMYSVSTRVKQLDEEGFIHLSFAHQVKKVADLAYRGMADLVLLQIDPARLRADVVVEAIGDSHEAFPHLYGALNVDAVETVRSYQPRADGTFDPVRASPEA